MYGARHLVGQHIDKEDRRVLAQGSLVGGGLGWAKHLAAQAPRRQGRAQRLGSRGVAGDQQHARRALHCGEAGRPIVERLSIAIGLQAHLKAPKARLACWHI